MAEARTSQTFLDLNPFLEDILVFGEHTLGETLTKVFLHKNTCILKWDGIQGTTH